jgi:hypothetical protein
MISWFENNQTKSVIIYTVFVAGTTWTIFNVLLDDKKLASAKAEVDQYKAKTEVLEAQTSHLRDEYQKYQGWLAATPGTVPYFESELAKANELAASVRAASPVVEPSMSTTSGRAAVLAPGESMVDPTTGAIVGAGRFNPDFTVDISITSPDGALNHTLAPRRARSGISTTNPSHIGSRCCALTGIRTKQPFHLES